MEAKQCQREIYLNTIKSIKKDKLVYLDESGIEEGIKSDRGWGKKGKRIYEERSGKYYNRINILSAICNNKPIAPLVFKGTCNTLLFNEWVKHILIKDLKKGQVVIMDNATFHKSRKTIDLIESGGCKVIFLPPYSPDLNPIEKFWANMKRWIRNNISGFQDINSAINFFFKYAAIQCN